MNKQHLVLLGMIGVFCAVTFINVFQWLNPLVEYPESSGGVLDIVRDEEEDGARVWTG